MRLYYTEKTWNSQDNGKKRKPERQPSTTSVHYRIVLFPLSGDSPFQSSHSLVVQYNQTIQFGFISLYRILLFRNVSYNIDTVPFNVQNGKCRLYVFHTVDYIMPFHNVKSERYHDTQN